MSIGMGPIWWFVPRIFVISMYRTRASPAGRTLNLITPSATNSSTPVQGRSLPVPSSVIRRVVHPDVHAALLGLLRPVVQEVGSEDRLPGPGPAGQRDETPGEEPPFEHPVELGQAGRCPLFGARFWNPRHGHLGHAISLFLALCMERATVSKKSVCGARRRMRTGTVTGGSSAAAPAAFESGTSWSGINLNSGYPFPKEN